MEFAKLRKRETYLILGSFGLVVCAVPIDFGLRMESFSKVCGCVVDRALSLDMVNEMIEDRVMLRPCKVHPQIAVSNFLTMHDE